jgi:hypothetical protein
VRARGESAQKSRGRDHEKECVQTFLLTCTPTPVMALFIYSKTASLLDISAPLQCGSILAGHSAPSQNSGPPPLCVLRPCPGSARSLYILARASLLSGLRSCSPIQTLDPACPRENTLALDLTSLQAEHSQDFVPRLHLDRRAAND